MLLDKGKIFSSTYNMKEKNPKNYVGEGHQMRWGNMRKMCGPKLSGYILVLPILQSQTFNLLT